MYLVLFLLSFSLGAADNWQIIGRTTDCERNVTIKAKEGEKSIRVIEGNKEKVLFPQGNQVFMKQSPITLKYDSYNRKRNVNGTRYIYLHPSMGGSKSGELKVSSEKDVITCPVKIF